jgi:hypothetical protein
MEARTVEDEALAIEELANQMEAKAAGAAYTSPYATPVKTAKPTATTNGVASAPVTEQLHLGQGRYDSPAAQRNVLEAASVENQGSKAVSLGEGTAVGIDGEDNTAEKEVAEEEPHVEGGHTRGSTVGEPMMERDTEEGEKGVSHLPGDPERVVVSEANEGEAAAAADAETKVRAIGAGLGEIGADNAMAILRNDVEIVAGLDAATFHVPPTREDYNNEATTKEAVEGEGDGDDLELVAATSDDTVQSEKPAALASISNPTSTISATAAAAPATLGTSTGSLDSRLAPVSAAGVGGSVPRDNVGGGGDTRTRTAVGRKGIRATGVDHAAGELEVTPDPKS